MTALVRRLAPAYRIVRSDGLQTELHGCKADLIDCPSTVVVHNVSKEVTILAVLATVRKEVALDEALRGSRIMSTKISSFSQREPYQLRARREPGVDISGVGVDPRLVDVAQRLELLKRQAIGRVSQLPWLAGDLSGLEVALQRIADHAVDEL